jgi:membrane protein DedA with SNARE-associated domain
MILLATVSLLVGALLAQRFRVMVLIPATAVVLVVAGATGVTSAHTVWSMILMAATAAIGMQVGYFVIGTGVRHVLTSAWSNRSSHLPSATAPTRYPAR